MNCSKGKLRVALFLLIGLFLPALLSAQTGPWAKFNGKMKGEALIRDASGGYLDEVRSIVEGGGDVNWQLQGSGLSPLIAAAGSGHLNIVQFLIEKGADPSLKDESGKTALDRAVMAGANDVVKYLRALQSGEPRPLDQSKLPSGPWARFNGTMKGQALVRDASGGYINEVRSIIEGGGDVNWQLEGGLSPLIGAASGGYLDVVKLLIENGADPGLKDQRGLTALDHAKAAGAGDVVRYLSGLSPAPAASAPIQNKAASVGVRSTGFVPWPAFRTYQVGQEVRFFAGSWKTGTITEVGALSTPGEKKFVPTDKKYLINRGQVNWNDWTDWGNVAGLEREPFWTGFFIGEWRIGEVMAANTRVEGAYQRDEYSFHSAVEALKINADMSYEWKPLGGQLIRGKWVPAEDGPGIVLLRAYQGADWTFRNETNAIEENIRGLENARLTTPGKMSIKAVRPISN